MILYHVQTKERDEARPRAGVLRTREFVMKDSYSFDRDVSGLDRSYELHIGAYDRIFDRCGLDWYRVESDVGVMGGLGAHEYMAPSAAGENAVAVAPDYAANVEIASAEARAIPLPPRLDEPTRAPTPGLTTVDEVAAALGVPAGAALKAIPVVVDGRGFVLTLVRGDHRLNEIKLRNALGADFRPARTEEIEAELGPPGFIGPVGASVPVLKDAAIQGEGYFGGANDPDTHLIGIVPGRDFTFDEADIRAVAAGDRSPGGYEIRIEPAIEVGNIFKLGTRFSAALGATFLDAEGKQNPIIMGSYGIGVGRVLATIVEQRHDERGIRWPESVAPFDVHLVGLNLETPEVNEAAESLYTVLRSTGRKVLFDDRPENAGVKFNDADLIGLPVRVTVSRRTVGQDQAEVKRREAEKAETIPLEQARRGEWP
jgi:prolyl-tRNA synthetase